MRNDFNRKLILEDGSEYLGYGFGAEEERVTEIVFNTSLVGYQEILSDPSYTDQTVVMAYPLIGNYGMAAEDFETERPAIGGLAVRDYNDLPSNFRSVQTLAEVMKTFGIPGIYGIDTRKLVRSIRDLGSRKALMTGVETTVEDGLRRIGACGMPKDAVARVSRKSPAWYPAEQGRYHVVAIDCGMKQNIVRNLNQKGCDVTVLPWNVHWQEVELLKPDGVFLSNGPGDPANVEPVITLVKQLRGRYPIFGICLGHQIISLAYGARTYKLKLNKIAARWPAKAVA